LQDVDIHGFLMLKCHTKNRQEYQQGDIYLIDKVRLNLNVKSEVTLLSTSLTVLRKDNEGSYDVESLELSQKQHDEEPVLKDVTGNEMLFSNALHDQKSVPYILTAPHQNEEAPPLLTSIKQITNHAQTILQEWSDSPELTPRLWTFKEILSWKIPDHLLSTTARE